MDNLFATNILSSFATDAYKAGHFLQLPPKSQQTKFYIAPRKPLRNDQPRYISFGIRYFIEKYLKTPITHKNIQDTKKIWDHFNLGGASYAFPEKGFKKIVDTYQGYLPLSIVGVKEGQILDKFNIPLFIISIYDADLVWLPGFIETALQRSIWYPSTVATISYTVKEKIKRAYEKSVDIENHSSLLTKLHDFGARGASSAETAAIGGLAHLINFIGTDTMEAVALGHTLYNIPIEELAYSIPASEHSTVTSWGNTADAEKKSLINMIETCEKHHDQIFSFVSDSYDFYHMIDKIWGDRQIIKKIKDAKLTPVVRPDSGNPIDVVLYALESLSKSWGYYVNNKGYKVLDTIRIIQGDGMSIEKIDSLIDAILNKNFSLENITFGMGGGLLQKLDRDSMSWSMKMYKIQIDNIWHNVQKKPSTQNNKISYNPQNIVDEKDWVCHYKYSKEMKEPEIFKDSFANIRKRAFL